MAYDVPLPTDATEAEEAYKRIVYAGKELLAPLLVRWYYTKSYLDGFRNFYNIDYRAGTLGRSRTDKSRKLKFIWEETLSKMQAQLGRLYGMDLTPRVARLTDSLDSQRKSAVAQVVLQSIVTPAMCDRLKTMITPPFLMYGTLGLRVYGKSKQEWGIEVCMPSTLIPLPVGVSSAADARGVLVRELVPMDYVKNTLSSQFKGQLDMARIEKFQVPIQALPANMRDGTEPYGSALFGTDSMFATDVPMTEFVGGSGGPVNGRSNPKAQNMIDMTTLGMVYLWDDSFKLKRQLAFVGNVRVADETFEKDRIYSPVVVIRDIDAGGFYGRSWCELQIPIDTENERALARQFQNLQDMDLYPRVAMPMGSGIPVLAEVAKDSCGPKVMRYEYDLSIPPEARRMEQIAPANSGMLPAAILRLGLEASSRMASQPTQMLSGQAPGRIDSASALGLLNESANIPLTPTADAIAFGISHVYRCLLGRSHRFWDNEDVVRITLLDDALAGIEYDPQSGGVKLAKSTIPHPDDVTVTIQARMPVSKMQEVMELKEHLKMGVIDLFDYRIQARLKNLDLPVGNEAEWQNYRRAKLENLLLYGNGEDVGQGVELSAEGDNHVIHVRVHEAFAARPEIYMASGAIRQRLRDHNNLHKVELGKLPDSMEYQEDAAQVEMARQNEMQPA